jgi:hypothetical protein
MTEFLAELYVPRTTAHAVGHARDRADRATAELTAEGTPVRLLSAIFVPTDETCLFLFEAASIDAVRETARRAALSFEHIAEAAAITDTTTPRQAPAGLSNEKRQN